MVQVGLVAGLVDWLLGVFHPTTSKVISGRVQCCDSAHSWRLYSLMRRCYYELKEAFTELNKAVLMSLMGLLL